MSNEVYSYKGRVIDIKKPVHVYRNLSVKGIRYSLKQGGKVVAHANRLYLEKCKFIVSEKGRKWVLVNNRKTVHAYISGYMTPEAEKEILQHEELPCIIEYNPYKYETFVCRNLFPFLDRIIPVKKAKFVLLNEKEVRGTELN